MQKHITPLEDTHLILASSLFILFSSSSLALALRMSAMKVTRPLYWFVAGLRSASEPRQMLFLSEDIVRYIGVRFDVS